MARFDLPSYSDDPRALVGRVLALDRDHLEYGERIIPGALKNGLARARLEADQVELIELADRFNPRCIYLWMVAVLLGAFSAAAYVVDGPVVAALLAVTALVNLAWGFWRVRTVHCVLHTRVGRLVYKSPGSRRLRRVTRDAFHAWAGINRIRVDDDSAAAAAVSDANGGRDGSEIQGRAHGDVTDVTSG